MRRRTAIAGGALAAVALAGGAAVLGGADDPGAPAAASAAGATASVERRDLVDRDEVDGTLGYAGARHAGRRRRRHDHARYATPGAVVRRGGSLYELDGAPAAFLLYGALPAWRDFTPGMEDGADVRQLERNLRALGHDPDGDLTVDAEWDWATTAAVRRFQDEHGLDEDGTVERGQVVFRRGPTRIGEAQGDGRAARVARHRARGRLLDRAPGDRRPRGDAPATRPRGRRA